MIAYMTFGIGFYIGASVCDLESFKGASGFSVLKGFIFGFALWPLALYWIIYNKLS